MLATASIIQEVVSRLTDAPCGPVVVDPVMVSTSGHRLLDAAAESALRQQLVPRADMLTPNLPEAQALTGLPAEVDGDKLLQALIALGPKSVYLKGGHSDDPSEVVDLFWDGERSHRLSAPRLATKNTHGTGCSLAAALASSLALGYSLADAAKAAHDWLHQAIAAADQLQVGSGHGPIHHAFERQTN